MKLSTLAFIASVAIVASPVASYARISAGECGSAFLDCSTGANLVGKSVTVYRTGDTGLHLDVRPSDFDSALGIGDQPGVKLAKIVKTYRTNIDSQKHGNAPQVGAFAVD